MRWPLDGLPPEVTIYEVGPRDGLQNESAVLPAAVKAEFITRLAGAGLRVIEAGDRSQCTRPVRQVMSGRGAARAALPQERDLLAADQAVCAGHHRTRLPGPSPGAAATPATSPPAAGS